MKPLALSLAAVAVATVTRLAFSQGSPLDIVANARLQDLMRLCQQQARSQVRVAPEEEAQSREYQAAAMECLHDNRAWYPLKR